MPDEPDGSAGASHREHGSAVHRRSWWWAVTVVALTLAILLATLVAHTLAQRARSTQATVPAPALPPLPVRAVAHPEAGALLVTYDPATGHLVTLASQREPFCPPVGPCQTARPDALTLLDSANGQPVAQTALTGSAATAASATLLLDDPIRQRAFAIAPDAVTIFATTDGALLGHYALSPAATWSGGALDPASGRLYLIGGGHELALDAPTGAVLASTALPLTAGAPAPDGPVFDAATRTLYVAIRPAISTGAPQLLALDAGTLQLVNTRSLPPGARLGPLDAATGALDIFGGDGRVWSVPAELAAAPSLTPMPMLDGALAVGVNRTLRRVYVARATQTLALDARTGRMLAGLPLAVRWPMAQPLLVDETRGLLFLPTDHGAIVIVRDDRAGNTGNTGVSPATAAILARAALAKLLPDTHQDPPFVAPETFPVGAGATAAPETRSQDYWIHFADRGWEGGYPGTASVAIAADRAHPGGYLVTFTITWRQLFQRTHSWVCVVAPDGAVALRSETGDTIP